MPATLRSKIAEPVVSPPVLRAGGMQRLGRRVALPLALALALGIVACSDDEPTPPSADVGTISGTVRRTTGGGVPGVEVNLSGPVNRTVVTSSSGAYSFDNLEPGEYTVSIELPDGYSLPEGSSASRSVTVTAGQTATVNFDLVAEGEENMVVVELAGTSFNPSTVTISVGQTVRWVWVSGGAHTVTPDGHSEWSSASLNQPGHTFQHTFNNAGEFPYICVPHEAAGMRGKVVVQ